MTPRDTANAVMGLSGVLGITRVANVTGLDSIGIPVVMVCRPNARSLAVSQGKGLDLDSARASGLMEALELYHAERITLPLRLASLNEMRFTNEVCAVGRLPRLRSSRFGADTSILWIEGQNLQNGKAMWLPYEMVHMNYTLPFPTGSGSFVMSSNGLASGNHVVEAINHGLCEVVERDAVTLWWHRDADEQDAARIDLASIDDAASRGLLDLYDKAGVSVGVWDVTSDLGVSAFMCIIADSREDRFHSLYPQYGMGCHSSRDVALLRALTEAAQTRLTTISGARDDSGRRKYERVRDEALVERIRRRLLQRGGRRFQDVPDFPGETLEEDRDAILARLMSAGLDEVLVVDLTRPEFEIPVVRVVVPGLEPYNEVEGYVPGARTQQILASRRRGPA